MGIPQLKLLDIRVSLLIAIQDMELAAKSPLLLDWFLHHCPAQIAELDLSGDGRTLFP